MKLPYLFLVVFSLLLAACGGGDRESAESNNVPEVLQRDDEADQMACVSVVTSRGIYSDLLWVCCSPTDNNAWGDPYQPAVEGDTITFQVEPGISYDLRCIDSNIRQYFKWDVAIEEEGYTWEVEESDPDNLFRYYSHVCEDEKNVCNLTIRTHGCGVLSSLEFSHMGSSGNVVVEHLDGQFIQPNSDYTLRLRTGKEYNLFVSNTYGEDFIFMNVQIDGSSAVFELTN